MQTDIAMYEVLVVLTSTFSDLEEDLLTTDCETWPPLSFIITKTALYCQTEVIASGGGCYQIRLSTE
jgi:hypothetical protein